MIYIHTITRDDMIVSTMGENQPSRKRGVHTDTRGMCSGTAVMYVSVKRKESLMNVNNHSKRSVLYLFPHKL